MQHRQFRQRLTWMSPTRSNRQRDGWKPVPKSSREHNVINIRPAVSVYATYRRLSYRTWGAVAEFVDNSTQNYYDHRKDLLRVYRREGNPGKLRIEAVYDGDRNVLTILDNANGMNLEELERAVVPDSPPPNPTGRSENAMGPKKPPSCFGKTWPIKKLL